MDELLRLLEAWRIMRLGTREVVDGLVAPEHRGPSPELRDVLDRWKGGWYWAESAQYQPPFQRSSTSRSSGEGPRCSGATSPSTTSRVPRRIIRHASRSRRSSSIEPLDVQVVNR